MLDLLTLGPKFTRPACRAAAAAINRYLLWARARPQQQTRRPTLLLSIDGTDRRTDGRTGGRRDTRPFYDSYCIPRGLRNNLSTNGQIYFFWLLWAAIDSIATPPAVSARVIALTRSSIWPVASPLEPRTGVDALSPRSWLGWWSTDSQVLPLNTEQVRRTLLAITACQRAWLMERRRAADTIRRYDTRCDFNVRSEADISQLLHETKN